MNMNKELEEFVTSARSLDEKSIEKYRKDKLSGNGRYSELPCDVQKFIDKGIFNTDMSSDEAALAYFRAYDTTADKQKLFDDFCTINDLITSQECAQADKYGLIR